MDSSGRADRKQKTEKRDLGGSMWGINIEENVKI